jgi:hypothetical protein
VSREAVEALLQRAAKRWRRAAAVCSERAIAGLGAPGAASLDGFGNLVFLSELARCATPDGRRAHSHPAAARLPRFASRGRSRGTA